MKYFIWIYIFTDFYVTPMLLIFAADNTNFFTLIYVIIVHLTFF